jgi:hypothetical protein
MLLAGFDRNSAGWCLEEIGIFGDGDHIWWSYLDLSESVQPEWYEEKKRNTTNYSVLKIIVLKFNGPPINLQH